MSEDVSDKGEAYARIIQSKERESEMYSAEIKRLQDLRSRADAIADRLRGNLMDAMRMVGATRINTSIGVWSIKNNPASVQIRNAGEIPDEYMTPQPSKVDKRAILSAYKMTGEIIPGVEIVREQRVEFK